MKRNLIAALLVVAATFLLVGGSALAQFVQCNARVGGECRGTPQSDLIAGTIRQDQIFALGGDDTINEPLVEGDDDEIRGGGGNDTIRDFNPANDNDTVFGGRGDDFINVREGLIGGGGADFVDCGPGNDTVVIDAAVFGATDSAVNCEKVITG